MKLNRGCLAARANSLILGRLYHNYNLFCLRNNFRQFKCNRVSKEKFHLLFYNGFTFISPKARQSQFLGSTTILIEMWQCRLRMLFPNRNFKVELLTAEETGGEMGILFYQSETWWANSSLKCSFGEMGSLEVRKCNGFPKAHKWKGLYLIKWNGNSNCRWRVR